MSYRGQTLHWVRVVLWPLPVLALLKALRALRRKPPDGV